MGWNTRKASELGEACNVTDRSSDKVTVEVVALRAVRGDRSRSLDGVCSHFGKRTVVVVVVAACLVLRFGFINFYIVYLDIVTEIAGPNWRMTEKLVFGRADFCGYSGEFHFVEEEDWIFLGLVCLTEQLIMS